MGLLVQTEAIWKSPKLAEDDHKLFVTLRIILDDSFLFEGLLKLPIHKQVLVVAKVFQRLKYLMPKTRKYL